MALRGRSGKEAGSRRTVERARTLQSETPSAKKLEILDCKLRDYATGKVEQADYEVDVWLQRRRPLTGGGGRQDPRLRTRPAGDASKMAREHCRSGRRRANVQAEHGRAQGERVCELAAGPDALGCCARGRAQEPHEEIRSPAVCEDDDAGAQVPAASKRLRGRSDKGARSEVGRMGDGGREREKGEGGEGEEREGAASRAAGGRAGVRPTRSEAMRQGPNPKESALLLCFCSGGRRAIRSGTWMPAQPISIARTDRPLTAAGVHYYSAKAASPGTSRCTLALPNAALCQSKRPRAGLSAGREPAGRVVSPTSLHQPARTSSLRCVLIDSRRSVPSSPASGPSIAHHAESFIRRQRLPIEILDRHQTLPPRQACREPIPFPVPARVCVARCCAAALVTYASTLDVICRLGRSRSRGRRFLYFPRFESPLLLLLLLLLLPQPPLCCFSAAKFRWQSNLGRSSSAAATLHAADQTVDHDAPRRSAHRSIRGSTSTNNNTGLFPIHHGERRLHCTRYPQLPCVVGTAGGGENERAGRQAAKSERPTPASAPASQPASVKSQDAPFASEDC
ncbi:hypothetical protein BDV95DRAFT_599359 [Massariosphaeria phaeospora]|uniref:Uncharacterized protein n=1 Tax=Massariosphaeria phaeospora TaxID=100035 RepID=A0A7C8I6Y0_9PLEO|nr:hypothetical protein BDV95DRAFT_599359 [Massariosphaeria phaeospora]